MKDMDINELNKMSVVAQFNKLISQTNFMGAEGETFAGLLEKNTTNSVFSADKKVDVEKKMAKNPTNEKEISSVYQREEKNVSKNKTAEKTNSKNSEKIDESSSQEDNADVNVKNEEKKSQAEDKIDDVSSQEDNLEKGKNEKAQNVSEKDSEPDLVPQPVVNMTPQVQSTEELTIVAEELELPQNIQILDENGLPLSLSDIKPKDLSQQDNLKIINTQTGEEIQISGAELMQKLAAMDQENLPQIGENMPALDAVASQAVQKENKENKTQSISDIAQNMANIETTETLSEESLLNLGGDDQPLKVDLTVKEEKISYADNKSIIRDILSLQQVDENAEDAATQSQTKTSATSSKTLPDSNILQNNIIAPQNTANAAEEKNAIMQSVNISEAKAVSSTNVGNQAVISEAELLASAKAESAGKSNQTSLNDVYKGMSKEAVEQVKVNITKSAVKGVDTIEISLKPEELGHIEIKMQIKSGKLQAHIISSRPETMEALQRDAQVLEKAFNEAGFQTDNNSLSFSFKNEGNQTQEQSEGLRNFIGKVFEQEANSDVMVAEAANQNWSAETGLNIRV